MEGQRDSLPEESSHSNTQSSQGNAEQHKLKDGKQTVHLSSGT